MPGGKTNKQTKNLDVQNRSSTPQSSRTDHQLKQYYDLVEHHYTSFRLLSVSLEYIRTLDTCLENSALKRSLIYCYFNIFRASRHLKHSTESTTTKISVPGKGRMTLRESTQDLQQSLHITLSTTVSLKYPQARFKQSHLKQMQMG